MGNDMTTFDINKVEDVLWSITEDCNLRCIYCSVDDGTSCLPIFELTKDQVDHVLSQLRALAGLKSLIISGGEALLSRNFPYVLAKASSLRSNLYVITNGVKLPSRAVDALRSHRPTVMITIDSTNEGINKYTRGIGTLEKILLTHNALQLLGLPIVVIAVITRFNIHSIREDLSFLYNRGVRNVLLQQMHCEGRAIGSLYAELSPAHEQVDILYKSLIEFEQYHPDMNIDYNEICFFPMRKAAYEEKCDRGLSYKPQRLFMCGAGFNFFAIKTNGDVIPCNALRSCIFGNLFRRDLVDILESSEEAMNVRRLRSLRVDSIAECKDCAYSPICDGGCRADVLHSTGNILAKHPYCNVQQTNSRTVLKGDINED